MRSWHCRVTMQPWKGYLRLDRSSFGWIHRGPSGTLAADCFAGTRKLCARPSLPPCKVGRLQLQVLAIMRLSLVSSSTPLWTASAVLVQDALGSMAPGCLATLSY